MAARKASSKSLSLAPVLDLNEASVLHGKLMGLRGSGVVIDASAVERVGTQCMQVLMAAARTWEEDKLAFSFNKVSDAFKATSQLIGVNINHLLSKEIQQ